MILYTVMESSMKEAGVNTLVGMGTVFIILIFISLIISCFTFISKIQNKLENTDKVDESTSSSIDNTLAQIVSNEEEELEDELELVAVITAAVMAYMGSAAPADGLVVRSIRKVR